MICPDCEMETNKLVKTTGTCTLCYKRFQNMKSRGMSYIKLVDIKGTKEYNRVMGRRNAAIERNTNKDSIDKPKKIKSTKKKLLPKDVVEVSLDNNEKIRERVRNNLKKSFQEKNCDLSVKKETQLYIIFLNFLKDIVSGKFESDNKMIYDMIHVIDKYVNDCEHEIQHADENNVQQIYEISIEHKYVQNERRDLKDIFIDRKTLENIANGIREGLSLETINKAIQDLNNSEEFRKDPKYVPYVNGDLTEKYDWAVGDPNINKEKDKSGVYDIYRVAVDVRGMYGSNHPQPFIRYVKAYDGSRAKEEFIKVLTNQFPNVSYNAYKVKVRLKSEMTSDELLADQELINNYTKNKIK